MSVQILREDQLVTSELPVGKVWSVKVKYQIESVLDFFILGIGISTELDVPIRTVYTPAAKVAPGQYEAVLSYTDFFLSSGRYNITVGLSNYEQTFSYYSDIISVIISDISEIYDERIVRTKATGLIINPLEIDVVKLV